MLRDNAFDWTFGVANSMKVEERRKWNRERWSKREEEEEEREEIGKVKRKIEDITSRPGSTCCKKENDTQ